MGAGPRADYGLWLVNNHLVDLSDLRQALAAAFDTGSFGLPFIAVHHKQTGERLTDKDLAVQYTKNEKKFWR